MKKLILLMFCMVLLVGSVSAGSFITEFDNVKNYDEETKTVDIRNSVLGIPFLQLSQIITAQLNTPQHVRVGLGYQKVAQFTLNPKQDYKDILGNFKFYDNEGNSIEKQIEIKYLAVEGVEVDDYESKCGLAINGTKECHKIVVGKKVVEKEVWKDFNNSVSANSEIIIGLFTETHEGEYVEWIPKIAGVRVSEWASWDAGLDVDIISYWNLDDATGLLARDSVDGEYNGTLKSAGGWTTGKIDGGFAINQTDIYDIDFASSPIADYQTDRYSVSAWILSDDIASSRYFHIEDDGGSTDFFLIRQLSGIIYTTFRSSATGTLDCNGNITILEGEWIHVVVVRNVDTMTSYINDTLNCKDVYGGTLGLPVDIDDFNMGSGGFTAAVAWDGKIDEYGIWNRSLTTTEITQLYNSGTGITRTIAIPPIVTMSHPINNSNYMINTIIANATVSDNFNVTKVEFYVDGVLNQTNQSQGIYNNSVFTFTVDLADGIHTMYINATDNDGGSTSGETRYVNIARFFENVFFWNSTSFETESETFIVNITTNGSIPGNAELIYNGTTFTGATVTNIAGDNYNLSRTIDVLTGAGNKTFNFNFTLGGKEFDTTTRDQTIGFLNWTFCSSGQPRLNFTFENETIAAEAIDATFNSNWFYWAGSGSTHKQLAYSDATENSNYTFCLPGAGSRDLDVNITTTYSNSISQQRQFTNSYLLGNETINVTLSLLPTAEGIFMTIQVINVAEQVLSDVDVNATRNGDLIGSGTTDDAGLITFFLDPNVAYTFGFTAEGFDTFITTITPQTQLTVTLGAVEVEPTDDFTRGIITSVSPGDVVLDPNTFQFFNFTLSSSFWTVEQYGFNLTAANGSILNTTSENANGGTVFVNHNTSGESQIFMTYYWIITGNETNAARSWIVFNVTGTGFSISNFFTDLSSYVDDGIFGITSNGLTIIIYILLFLIVGVMSSRFGITSPVAVTSMLFLIVLFFEVQLDLIPSPPGVLSGVPFVTVFIGIILISLLIKERSR